MICRALHHVWKSLNCNIIAVKRKMWVKQLCFRFELKTVCLFFFFFKFIDQSLCGLIHRNCCQCASAIWKMSSIKPIRRKRILNRFDYNLITKSNSVTQLFSWCSLHFASVRRWHPRSDPGSGWTAWRHSETEKRGQRFGGEN